MPRTRLVTDLDRRSFLTVAGAVTASTGIALTFGGGGRASAARPESVTPALSRTAPPPPLAPYTSGTTLQTVAAPLGGSGFRRLGDGPAWPRVVRSELAAAKRGRDERRTPLAAFVQLTDLHIVDVQHPLRYEFLRAQTTSAWRPQEPLTVAGAVSLVERVNALRGAPATGAPLSFVMTTGDTTDNNARCELDWYLRVLSGGTITPDTGDPRRYEGVQDSGLPLYWHPGDAIRDADKRLGFPRIDGLLDAARRPVRSPGLNVPWYATVGNHDVLPGGCYAPGDEGWFRDFAVGGRKLMSLDEERGKAFWRTVKKGLDPKGADFRELMRTEARRLRPVTPDPDRAPFTPAEYVAAHLDPAHTGPGPAGHGFTAENVDSGTRHYTFRISDEVIGISLDTTDPGGHYEGSLGTAQLSWLERTLKNNKDAYAIVFSHHTGASMRNERPDPAHPDEARHGGDELTALLEKHAGVVAWVNGHSHKNAITAHDGFWEISTASHIDFPQLARVIELTDNGDGTLSLFTTLIESSAPHRTDFEDLSQPGLAALYREISLNVPGAKQTLSGTPADRNTELVLPKP
ncbi:Calcineurin-like phosphoesterase [Streptomyces sp. YIM 130001]|uniref:TIGR03767 family metallophosphoesterase n=1 Tax=Streptomyces sp. YIM 130001 TaxID=2259644 RepID=UPI000E652782|nr:TIGR03767 family metallophosphoesterase [Streptomyces sp. YIM 130001]RII19490.1 Calcineurin-like phosphoesterase [Streptomyces sp. YIM 130001]